MVNRTFTVEMYVEDGVQKVFISTDGASGYKRVIYDINDVGRHVVNYIKDYDEEILDWAIHYVPDATDVPSVVNAHTHGISEHYGHMDLQMVIGTPDEVAFVLNYFGRKIRDGEHFKDGDIVNVPIKCHSSMTILMKEFKECGRPVLRLVVADGYGKFPDDEDCFRSYKLQLIDFPE